MDTEGRTPVIIQAEAGDRRFDELLRLSALILDQDRYLLAAIDHAEESHILGTFDGDRCVGFLRFHIQQIGRDVGRPPVLHQGGPLSEGYVDAFGVDPTSRRLGIGNELQAFAIDYCRRAGCYQMRSRSPVTSTENYALKLHAGYALHPSSENDSYYFVLAL